MLFAAKEVLSAKSKQENANSFVLTPMCVWTGLNQQCHVIMCMTARCQLSMHKTLDCQLNLPVVAYIQYVSFFVSVICMSVSLCVCVSMCLCVCVSVCLCIDVSIHLTVSSIYPLSYSTSVCLCVEPATSVPMSPNATLNRVRIAPRCKRQQK